MNLSYRYLGMSSRNIKVSFSVMLVSIMKLCCRWHIACEIGESDGHTLVACTAGSCDSGGAHRGHTYCTQYSLVEGIYVEANGDFPVSPLCMRLSHSTLCITTNSIKDAAQIIASIWRKWDIVNDRPLPEGVERVWSEHGGRKSEVVWKKTGRPYYTSTSNSSA
jgi:hypothetical protein